MTLSAPLLTTFQSCPRRYALEGEYRAARWRPKQLYENLLRAAVLSISGGAPVTEASEVAATHFLEQAAKPGLETLRDPYVIAHDFTAILQTTLQAISRSLPGKLKPGPLVHVSDHHWQCSAFLDDSGTLHRYSAVESLDDDSLSRELHGWHVFGDVAATQTPMVSHLIEIGRQSRGHQHTAWCRAYKHPVILGHCRFRHTDGSKLEGNWKPVWFQDSDRNNAKDWVDLMEKDGLTLIRNVSVRVPNAEHIENFRRDVATEAVRMAMTGPWRDTPLTRAACDLPYTCPWQAACYSSRTADVEALGGYVKVNPAAK